MKHLRTYLLLLSLLPALSGIAQGKRWKIDDILVLKNGTTYTGKIVQAIPDSIYKIELVGGSVVVVRYADVVAFHKEKNPAPKKQFQCDTSDGRYQPYLPVSAYYRYKPKGYFLQAHLYAILDFGIDVINGYKFNRYAYLGLGVGIHAYALGLPRTAAVDLSSGGYIPVYVFYGGDILRSRITPYYSASAGYSIPLNAFYQYGNSYSYGNKVKLHGGATGSLGFGAKFYGRRIYPSVGAHVTLQQGTYTRDSYQDIGNGNIVHQYTSGSSLMVIPSFDLGICF